MITAGTDSSTVFIENGGWPGRPIVTGLAATLRRECRAPEIRWHWVRTDL